MEHRSSSRLKNVSRSANLSLLALLALATLCLSACTGAGRIDAAGQPPAKMEDIVFSGGNFVAGASQGVEVKNQGLVQSPTAFKSDFTSPAIRAPIPFNALVPRWIADLPGGSTMEIRVRTGKSGQVWSPWTDIHVHSDWTDPESDEQVGQMVVVPAADVTHDYFQYMVTFDRDTSLTAPALRELRFTFIDSTDGPTVDELLAGQEELDAETESQGVAPTAGYPKPFVVSRQVWCRHPDCVYSQGLKYQRVTHLIVHHTVSNNNSADWAAVVRAIWNYHTYSNNWGDIGYNYLVDPNGVIYEGHYGGDDVVGTHAAGANAGSMAVALLGTFTAPDGRPPGIAPPQPMLNSAVDILAWKADQRDIDVFDASNALPNINWGLPHLMGHRDVYGTTECPGEQAHDLLPWMRDRIAERIGLVSPHIYIDELGPDFTRSNAVWRDGPYSCGHNTHAFYTWSTTNAAESTNWGEWRLRVPVSGRYRVEVYAPYCNTGRGETRGATYTVRHAEGVSTVKVSHQDRIGLWTSLGDFNLTAGSNHAVRLTDLTTTDSGLGVWFDAIRLLPLQVAPTVNNILPASDGLLNQRAVTFTWQITNAENVSRTTLQVASDPAFGNLVVNQSWNGAVTTFTTTFAQDYPNLYWRVTLTPAMGSPVVGPAWRFGLDATPPESAVGRPAWLGWSRSYHVTWTGSDALSGVVRYSVQYRPEDGQWQTWLSDTMATAAIFTPPNPARVYEFRSQAVDAAGNRESYPDLADATTAQARQLMNTNLIPLTVRP